MDFQNPGNGPIYSRDHRSPRAIEDNFKNDFSMRAFHAGRQLYDGGRHMNALMALRYGLERDPDELRLHMMLIVTYMSLGKKPEADRRMAIVRLLHPSEEARQLIQGFIDKWEFIEDSVGELPIGADAGGEGPPLFTASLLGLDGQFGNQIFQYAFGKLYSEKHGLRFEVYDWIGKKLFGLRDPGISRILPFIPEIDYAREDMFALSPEELGVRDRDTQGYFQFHTKHYAPYRDRFLSYFRPVSVVEWMIKPFFQDLRSRGSTLVAIHLRLKDAAEQGRAAAVAIYVEWLKEIWPTLDNPVLFLASDSLETVRPDLEAFHPFTSEGLMLPLINMDFYPDFYVMTQADYLAAGNSTFSFSASMLNERAKLFVRPNADNSRLVPYDPWNASSTI